MKITAVADELTVQALSLMGIIGAAVASPEEADAAIDRLAGPDTVILITDAVADMVRQKVDKLKIARENVAVLEIPSVNSAPRQAEDIAHLVSQAIGVKI